MLNVVLSYLDETIMRDNLITRFRKGVDNSAFNHLRCFSVLMFFVRVNLICVYKLIIVITIVCRQCFKTFFKENNIDITLPNSRAGDPL